MPGRVIITGGTGFIGRHLCIRLVELDYEVVALTRNIKAAEGHLPEDVKCAKWDGKTSGGWLKFVNGADAIINLAGENISGHRWTDEIKKRIVESRVSAANAIVDAVKKAKNKPRLVMQASAAGFYGSCGARPVDESSPQGRGFLAEVCRQWEDSSKAVRDIGANWIAMRSGIVLGHGGALDKMVQPFKYFMGATAGGAQWVSWIHIEDEIRAMIFLLEKQDAGGAYNLTSPNPAKMKEFGVAIGHATKKHSWLQIPSFLVETALGEMARETVLASQKVSPKRLVEAGFKFEFPNIEKAMQDILAR